MKSKQNIRWTSLLALSCLVSMGLAYADSDQQAGKAATSTNTTTSSKTVFKDQTVKMKNPKDVCTGLIDAAKKDDLNAFQLWTMSYRDTGTSTSETGAGSAGEVGTDMSKSKSMPGSSENLSGNYKFPREEMARFKDLTCSSEHIAGSHAVVEVDTKSGEKRLIPFVMERGQWKFDPRTYTSFYNIGWSGSEHTG
jgi:hypothetical protein